MNSKEKSAKIAESNIISEFEKEIYGTMPPRPEHLSVEVVGEDRGFAAGRGTHRVLSFTAHFGKERFSFTVNEVLPNTENPLPVFLHIDNSPCVPSKFTPHEELCDEGFCVFSFSAYDISGNDANFRSGLTKHFGARRSYSAPGKLTAWAWAAMRVMDYIETLDYVDKERVAVIGNENLGKAALLAGVYDTRFTHVLLNCSGLLGASLTKGNTGKPLLALVEEEGYLFNPGFVKRMQKRGYTSTLDQDALLSLIAPRYLVIGSASGDYNGDLQSDFSSAVLASAAYEKLGYRGLVHNGIAPKANELLDGGRIIHYARDGIAYLSRHDWRVYMEILKR